MTSIRPARSDDARATADVLVDTWKTTFRGRLPEAALSHLDVEHQTARHRRQMNQPGVAYRVAVEADDRVIGFASGGPDRTEADPCDAEIYALYVRDAYHGHGVGRGLMSSLADPLAHQGHTSLRVWVLAVNPALGFYERLGGRRGRTGMIELGGRPFEQVALVWDDLRRLV